MNLNIFDVLDNIDDKVIIRDKNNVILYANKMAIQLSNKNVNNTSHFIYDDKVYYYKKKTIGNLEIEIYHDVTNYSKKIASLKRDFLTNLLNRHAIFQKLNIIDAKAKKDNTNYCIAIGDIDYFKNINDKYGHLVGDEVLKGVSDILIENVPDGSLVGRFGGEEFIIVLPNTNIEDSFNCIEDIRRVVVNNKFIIDDKELNITITFGLAVSSEDKTPLEVINDADESLYYGKNNGRNQTNYL